MHIELSKDNKNKLLIASGKANKSAGNLVNLILENIDIEIIQRQEGNVKSGISVIIEFKAVIKKNQIDT